MKTTLKTLVGFIDDFKLTNPEGAVCFDGTIYFSSSSISTKFITEIHILAISVSNISVLYFLNPQIAEYGIPNMFRDDEQSFTYLDKEALIIKGQTHIYGNYVIAIHPEKRNISSGTNN